MDKKNPILFLCLFTYNVSIIVYIVFLLLFQLVSC